jgi:hypothetical protein
MGEPLAAVMRARDVEDDIAAFRKQLATVQLELRDSLALGRIAEELIRLNAWLREQGREKR